MNNLESFEQLWRQQPAPATTALSAVRAVQNSASQIVNSRTRVLRWGIGTVVASLFITQLLTVVNYTAVGRAPGFAGLIHSGVMLAFQIGLLIVLLRQQRAHRELRKHSADTVYDGLRAKLAMIELEMRDYRIGLPLATALLLIDLVPIWDGFHQGHFDASGALARGTFLLLFGAGILGIAARHLRRVLEPQRTQVLDTLQSFDKE